MDQSECGVRVDGDERGVVGGAGVRRAFGSAVLVGASALLVGACAGPPSAVRAVAPPAVRLAPGVEARAVGDTDSAAVEEPVGAAVDPAPSLSDLVRHGLDRDPGLAALREHRAAAEARTEFAAQPPRPRLAYLEFLEDIETRVGPNERRLELSQAWPWFGTLEARRLEADRAAGAVGARLVAAEAAATERIERAWVELAHAARVETLLAENLELLMALSDVVQARVESGAPRTDWLRLEVEVVELEARVADAGDRRAALAVALREASAWPEPLDASELTEPLPFDLGAVALEQLVGERNPELGALAAEVRRAEAGRELADLAGRPDLAFRLLYLDVDDAANSSVPGSGDDPVGLGVSLSVPLWRGDSARGRAADHELRAAQLTVRSHASDLRAELAALLAEHATAERDLTLVRDRLLPRARETYELLLTSYRGGEATLLELIDAERALVDYELDRWRAVRDIRVARARLAALTGGARL